MVKTQRSTSQQSVTQDSDYAYNAYTATQDSNQWHDCYAGQPQQPGSAPRLPETDIAKVMPTFDQVGFYLASTHQMAPQSTHPIKQACYSGWWWCCCCCRDTVRERVQQIGSPAAEHCTEVTTITAT